MDEDNPDYLVHEIFTQNFFKDHPLGKPILGTKETVKRFERPPVVDAYAHRFAPATSSCPRPATSITTASSNWSPDTSST